MFYDPKGESVTTTTLDRPVVEARCFEQSRRPSQGEVNRAIIAEAEAQGLFCSRGYAHDFVCYLRDVCRWIRESAEETGFRVSEMPYHITRLELEYYLPLLEVIIPDEAIAATGSAHAMLNRLLCRDNEVALRHTVDCGIVAYCAVAIDLIAA